MANVDTRYMAAAIALAQRGRGRSTPNPNVGCIIVNNGRVVGRGWTQAGGRPHAEAMALEQAGKAAKGSTIYTTLEPCVHDSDRGPSCCSLVIAAHPARVVVATLDADERTRRIGIDALGQAGIAVSVGMLEREARRAMAGFLTRMEKGRPHVTLKLATSLDGCIAMADGTSKWITSERSRAHGHLERARSDGILVGSGTLRADQPRLNVRLPGLEDRSPQTFLLGSEDSAEGWHSLSEPAEIAGLTDINWLLVEGGAQTAAAFIKADLVDRLVLYRAPIIIGGGLTGIGDIGLSSLEAAHGQWRLYDSRQFDQDRLEIYDRAA